MKKDENSLNVLVAGVGGQGILFFGNLLLEAYNSKGLKGVISEVHGMAQRGGSVEIHIRLGDVYSPLIPPGAVDVLVGLELVEAVRRVGYLSEESILLTNTQIIRPGLPGVKVPSKEELLNYVKSLGIKFYGVPADELALKAGSIISVNVVMLGALYGLGILNEAITFEDFTKVISRFPFKEVNLRAFELGHNYIKDRLNT